MTPSDFSVVATGSATPATSMESIEVAERGWVAVPSTMACDLSAFNSNLFNMYQNNDLLVESLRFRCTTVSFEALGKGGGSLGIDLGYENQSQNDSS